MLNSIMKLRILCFKLASTIFIAYVLVNHAVPNFTHNNRLLAQERTNLTKSKIST
jgi:cell division protein FtsL